MNKEELLEEARERYTNYSRETKGRMFKTFEGSFNVPYVNSPAGIGHRGLVRFVPEYLCYDEKNDAILTWGWGLGCVYLRGEWAPIEGQPILPLIYEIF